MEDLLGLLEEFDAEDELSASARADASGGHAEPSPGPDAPEPEQLRTLDPSALDEIGVGGGEALLGVEAPASPKPRAQAAAASSSSRAVVCPELVPIESKITNTPCTND